MCEPGTKPVEPLNVVHGERAASARTSQRQVCHSKSPAGGADHRVQNPAGIEWSLYFPIPAALLPAPALQMQKPADPNRVEAGRPKGHGAGWVINKPPPHTLTENRCRSRGFGIGAAEGGIRL